MHALKVSQANSHENSIIGHIRRRDSSDQNILYSIMTNTNVLTGYLLPTCYITYKALEVLR